jgi:Ser/Thr protein kinase RdoA (MazF antagonist)
MEPHIRERFHDAILHEAMRRYGIAADGIRPLAATESFIYEFQRGSDAYILRISHGLRRSAALIHGEINWINHLAAGGVPVARAMPSARDEWVEAIEDGQGGAFLATAFVKARGGPAWDAPWTPAFYESYGRLIGSMHALTQGYAPPDPGWRRPHWNDEGMEFVDHYLPASETALLDTYHALCEHFRTLPTDRASYGLVHYDAHPANLFISEDGRLTLFDFDECAYSWFACDIAIVLFYCATEAEDPLAFTQQFMTHFLRGYRQANMLDARWLAEIPHFLKLREIEMVAAIQRDYGAGPIDDAWCARFMHGRKARIEQDVPTIEFDFTSLTEGEV